MPANLFEYVAIYNPKATKDSNGNDTTPKAELVLPVTQILAKSEKEVITLASRQLEEKWLDKLDEVEIKIRPF